MISLARWAEPWAELGLAARMELHAELRKRYSEPHRAYHTLHHLAECLQLLEQTRGLARHPAAMELAIWFHDAIHDPRRSDNERRSAEWAQAELRRAGATAELQREVFDLVMITRHQDAPQTPDQALFSDIDLAILGAGPARFDEYEQQLRHEYAHVPARQFRAARRTLLSAFLDRPRLYHSDWFFERREAQARANLQRAVSRLAVATR